MLVTALNSVFNWGMHVQAINNTAATAHVQPLSKTANDKNNKISGVARSFN